MTSFPDWQTSPRAAVSTATVVHRYGRTATVQTAVLDTLWYGVFGPQQGRVVLVRDKARAGYDIALVSTDLAVTPARVIERYAARWSIEVAIEDAKQTTGVGQARNRLATTVGRTVPFGLVITSLAICWYATTGYHPDDVTAARELAGVASRAPSLRRWMWRGLLSSAGASYSVGGWAQGVLETAGVAWLVRMLGQLSG